MGRNDCKNFKDNPIPSMHDLGYVPAIISAKLNACNTYFVQRVLFILIAIVMLIVFQVVGTATKDSIPDVPMFSANPAKRPRRQELTNTLTVVWQTIANAITPQVGTREAPVPVEQVLNCLR